MSALPTPIDRKAFEAPRRDFEALEKRLRALVASTAPLRYEDANVAKDFDDRAKAFLDKKNPESPEAKIGPHRDDAHKTWKGLIAWLNDEERGALTVRKLCSTIASRYERERLVRLAQQRREDEARQITEQKRTQKADVDHLLTIAATSNDPGALQAAIDRENVPLAPFVSSVDPNAGKVPGSSVTLKKAGLIVDAKAFFTENPWSVLADMIDLKSDVNESGPALRIMPSALDDKLNRGLTLKGVRVFERDITRNVSRE